MTDETIRFVIILLAMAIFGVLTLQVRLRKRVEKLEELKE
jgi:hypothetical protein